MRRDDHCFQVVNLLEFVGFSVGCTGHAGQLAVHAEVVLESNRGQRLVLALNRHAFLGFHRLMQTITPAPPRHQAAGEFVNDDHFAVLHNIVFVAVVQRMGA